MRPIDNLRLFEKMSALFECYDRLALLTTDNEVLFMKYATLADIGTLPQCAEVSHKYLQIQDGDIVLTNDPYSGGTILSSPTLVMGVGTRNVKGNVPAEFLVVFRLTLTPKVAPAKTIDDEGLRIPPSPLYARGVANQAILDALKAHPMTPGNLLPLIEKWAKRLLETRERFKREYNSSDLNLTKGQIKNYLQDTEHEFSKRIDEFREGTGAIELQISPTEAIKLRAEHRESHWLFDFAGTTPGATLFMTDSATMGAAVGTVLGIMNLDAPINTGLLNRFEIKAPRGSMVNAAFPRPLYLGHTDGLNLIANAVALALGQIDTRLAWASSGPSYCSYELRFQDGRSFFDSLPVGGGASKKSKGSDGVYIWRRLPVNDSIEVCESEYPLQIVSAGFRASSGGAGLHIGGRGVAKTVRLIEAAELAWQFVSPIHKPEGVNGGKSALGPEMIVHFADGREQTLAHSGRIQLARGDQFTVLGPGGGGFGPA